jgi:putative ABC transport system substrate-binding protein
MVHHTSRVASPLVARAQQSTKMKRIAMVHPSDPPDSMFPSVHPFYQAFFDELNGVGFVEGKNLIVERYSAEGDTRRYLPMMRDVLDARPDAIYALARTKTACIRIS